MDFFKSIPTHMDYDGQKRAEKYFQYIIIAFAVAGLAWGWHAERFSYTVGTLAIGFAAASLLTLPPWPMYRQKPLKWQKVKKST